MNSFMSWVGGKKALREEVVRRFPLYYERYIEVFGGGGWVLFHKNPGNDFEVYNDFNGLLTNLYRCVREKPDLLMGSLRYVLNAREDFDRARLALRRKRTTSVQRAAWFYQIIRHPGIQIVIRQLPHFLQKHLLGDRLPPALHQILQESKFRGCHGKVGAVHGHAAGTRVQA